MATRGGASGSPSNRRRPERRTVISALLLCIVLTAVPPWHRKGRLVYADVGSVDIDGNAGYAPIFRPPLRSTIDFARLGMSYVVVVLVAAVDIYRRRTASSLGEEN